MKRTTKSFLSGLMLSTVVCLMIIGSATYYLYYYGLPLYTNNIKDEYSKQLSEDYVDAYRLKRDIGRGEAIVSEDLELVMLPNSLESKGIVSLWEEDALIYASRDLSQGMVCYQDMLYNPVSLPSDVRLYEMNALVLPLTLKPKDWIDVRISFPSGLDYVVLSKKEVVHLIADSNGIDSTAEMESSNLVKSQLLILQMSADEILRYSSALVDAFFNPGTFLYTTVYVNPDAQAAAVVNYPCNEQVQQLMQDDPNILDGAKRFMAVKQREFLNNSISKLNSNVTRPDPRSEFMSNQYKLVEKETSLSDLDD